MNLKPNDPFRTNTSAEELSNTVVKKIRSEAQGKDYDAVFTVENPATKQAIIDLPDYRGEVALQALTKADTAGALWAKTTPRHRADLLMNAYALMQAHKEELAHLITYEMGKPLAESYTEVDYASDYIRWFAEELLRPQGNYREAPHGGSWILTTRIPVGTSLLITPWNFPMAMVTRKVAPALAAGCGAVIKPPALTPLTTLYTAQLFVEAGIPEDLLQVVTTTHSSEFSKLLMADERVRKVSFTGSTPVGSTLLAQAAKNVMKSSMELGGNAPLLVFDDADLERAVEGAFIAKLRNGGQSCVSANRILVQDGIADDFVELFTEKMSQVIVGNGLNPEVTLGPVIDEKALNGHKQMIADALERGANLTTGGNQSSEQGYFLEATVLDNVPADAVISCNEIFGPIAAISRFSTQEEAITQANSSPFGLAAYVFSENIDRTFHVAHSLEAGMIGINQGIVSNVAAPFGGIKQSGLGREGSYEGLEEYQEIKFMNVNERPSK